MSRLLSGLVQSIINRYLQKWLKNVTTEHATIWGGEMVFKNVELRLDVLQEELGLPLVFTRGFIQELRVYVPLASLLRDSIKFTLTNLEVVASTPAEPVGLRTPKKNSSKRSQTPPQRTRHLSDARTADDAEKQPSWMHSVLQRVLQNIGVEIRNLVFKYSTDSYVSSVSWKALSLTSSNGNWEPAFANPEGETRAIYKMLNVDDITWCLDALDTGGKTAYQTPLFNRESVAIRAILRSQPEGDITQHEPYQLPALQVDVQVPHVLLTVSQHQVTMLSMLVSEVALMASKIAKAKATKDSPSSSFAKRYPSDPTLTAPRSPSPLGHTPSSDKWDGMCGDEAKGGVARGSVDVQEAAANDVGILSMADDLRRAASLDAGVVGFGGEEGWGVLPGRPAEGKKGWLAYFWGEEGEEEELEEEEEEAEGTGGEANERRKLASTIMIASLSVPYAGFVYKSAPPAAAAPAVDESAAAAAAAAARGAQGGTLDVAGTGITLLFRQMKLDLPPSTAHGGGGAGPRGGAGGGPYGGAGAGLLAGAVT